MPRPQTLLFAMKLLGIAEEAQQSLTEEEVLEAFINITTAIQDQHLQAQAAKQIALRIEAATKRNPNLVN